MTKAYTREINQNSEDSHQTSPHWVCTFIRWSNRDPINFTQGPAAERTRRPLVVENDCIAVNVSNSKDNQTPSATMTLMSGDLNYGTAIAPGDFVMINMVNWTSKARELRDRAVNLRPINRKNDGFKGVFKVNSVNKILFDDPETGTKHLRYQITAYGFTEFNHSIYYNPTLPKSVADLVLTTSANSDLVKQLRTTNKVQKLMQIIPKLILGESFKNTINEKAVITKKPQFVIPQDVFTLLGLKGKYAVDLYTFMIGIWNNFQTGSFTPEEKGMNPVTRTTGTTFKETNKELSGRTIAGTNSINNVRLWDFMKKYSNSVINEMYSTYRISENGNILPTLVIRQKPFNSQHFDSGVFNRGRYFHKSPPKVAHTKFLTLPRWKLDASLITAINVSKNESLRFNFVQVFGLSKLPTDNANMSVQVAKGNYEFDERDIKNHGLKPYIATAEFDYPFGEEGSKSDAKGTLAVDWSQLVWDWVHGGHLRLNGTIECIGIEENISVGDNLQVGNWVFHIDEISHTAHDNGEGIKTFRTSIKVTHGMDARSTKFGPLYPEMAHTDTYTDRLEDYSNEKLLPGFSDTQDIRGRTDGEEIDETRQGDFTPINLRPKK